MASDFYHVHLDGLRIGGAPTLPQAVLMIDNHRATTFPDIKKAHIVRESSGGGANDEWVVYRAAREDDEWVVLEDETGGPLGLKRPAKPGRRSRLSPLATRATRATRTTPATTHA